MYYIDDWGHDVSFNRPGDEVYETRGATVRISTNEEEYMQHQRQPAEIDPADDW